MRRLYTPQGAGPGDGLVFHVFFGFAKMAERDRWVVSDALPHIADDIARLIEAGYTVILDTEGTHARLKAALASATPETDGLRTCGVYWCGQGWPDGGLSDAAGGRLRPAQLDASAIDPAARLVVLCACHSGAELEAWDTAMGPHAQVFAWAGEVGPEQALRFLTAGHHEETGLDDLIEHFLLQPPSGAPGAEAFDRVLATQQALSAGARARSSVLDTLPARPSAQSPPPEDVTRTAPTVRHVRRDGLVTSIFKAISGGKAFDQVVQEQLQRVPLLARVKGTPLVPELITHAGSQVAGSIKTPWASTLIQSATNATAKALAPQAPADAPDTPSPSDSAPTDGDAVLADTVAPHVPGDALPSSASVSAHAATMDVAAEVRTTRQAANAPPADTSDADPEVAPNVMTQSLRMRIPSRRAAPAPQSERHPPSTQRRAAHVSTPPPSAAPQRDPSPSVMTPRDVERALKFTAQNLGGSAQWIGAKLCLRIPLNQRAQWVYASLDALADSPALILQSRVCRLDAAPPDLTPCLRLLSRTSFTRLVIVYEEPGEILIGQIQLPAEALNTRRIHQAIRELATFADSMEDLLSGKDEH